MYSVTMGNLLWNVSDTMIFEVRLLTWKIIDSDFLGQFEDIDKTILFDDSWKMSMEWLRVPVRPPPAAWSFGDVSCEYGYSLVSVY